MTAQMPVESYLRDKELIPADDLPPDKEIKPHLYERLKDWCVRQGITSGRSGRPWRDHLGSRLSDLGEMMCVELRIRADSLGEIDAFLINGPDRLLLLLDWLVREQAKPLTERLNREPPDGIILERWEQSLENERNHFRRHFAPLEELLSRGGSAWRVDVDPAGIFERVTDSERKVFKEATSARDAAAEHLNAAWEAAWRVEPNGQVAFDEAVKAVEAALRAVVTPNDGTAQLGKIRGQLKASQEHYTSRLERTPEGSEGQPATRGQLKASQEHYTSRLERTPEGSEGQPAPPFANEGVQMIYELTGSLWRSHRRHGQTEKRVPHDVEEGRDAVTLATALIAMQRRGFLERTAGKR